MKMKLRSLALASILCTSFATVASERTEDLVGATGQCLSYLSMFNEADLKDKTTRTRDLSELFKSSFAEALQQPSIRKTIESGFFAKSGADFNKDFYSGFVLSGIFSETTKKIKDSIPQDEAVKLSYSELKQRWGDLALKAYASENCDLIK
ncbi:hypothetical protein [uncultured Pantoea sp.]|uniref:hypothetical protein n=1 Tax=uncultured Pantoea sp. TaxID=218084 RepID=UPI0025D0AC7A|nr:hypothetical protein [uncultured Pantoea sp.]